MLPNFGDNSESTSERLLRTVFVTVVSYCTLCHHIGSFSQTSLAFHAHVINVCNIPGMSWVDRRCTRIDNAFPIGVEIQPFIG